MKKWFLLLLPTLAFADDASRIAASRTAVDSIAVSRSYLSTTLGITVMNSIMHPDWVQVDFPLTASSGEAKRRIEAAIRHLILKGGEPAYRDSTTGCRGDSMFGLGFRVEYTCIGTLRWKF